MTTAADEFPSSTGAAETRRSVRLLSVLLCARDTGFEPVPGAAIHTIAYLADALSPVWGLPILDAQVLKQATRPNFPALQRDLDTLVARGMVGVVGPLFSTSNQDNSPTSANFALAPLAQAALDLITSTNYLRREFDFIKEITYGAAALGPDGLAGIGKVDASYADPFADIGSVIELDAPGAGRLTTPEVARRFRKLAPDADLSDSQLVHLYLRHLYSRLRAA